MREGKLGSRAIERMVIQLIEWYRWSISEMSLNSHILRLGAFRVSIWQEGVSVDVIYT